LGSLAQTAVTVKIKPITSLLTANFQVNMVYRFSLVLFLSEESLGIVDRKRNNEKETKVLAVVVCLFLITEF